MVATDLAEALARAGTPFHQAHQIVGRLVLESVRSGKKPARLDGGATAAIRARVHGRISRAARPPEGMKIARDLPGGTGPQAVAAALAAAKQRLAMT